MEVSEPARTNLFFAAGLSMALTAAFLTGCPRDSSDKMKADGGPLGPSGTIATIAGAAGGAFAGNTIEKNMKKQVAYRITVLMADGSKRILTQSAAPAFAVGERVRVVNHRIVARV